MWSFPNAIPNLRLRKVSTEPNLCCADLSDEDTGSSSSKGEGLECPICWESFNIVENVPCVLWCGHTLCQNCVLGLQWAVLKLPAQKFKLPFFVACPWCNLLSFRWVYRGNLKFPRKNYFILWMVENLNGESDNHILCRLIKDLCIVEYWYCTNVHTCCFCSYFACTWDCPANQTRKYVTETHKMYQYISVEHHIRVSVL